MPLSTTLAEVITAGIRVALDELHTCMPGQVYRYDATTQRAHVSPVISQVTFDHDGNRKINQMSMLYEVPILWPRAGGYSLHFPLKEGDLVMLVFAECDLGLWRTNPKAERDPKKPDADIGAAQREPQDLRRHAFSSNFAFAIPGVYPDQYPIEDAPTDHAVLVVPAGGKLRVSTAGADHTEKVALAEKVAAQLTTLKNAIQNATPVAQDGGAALKTAILSALTNWPESVASTTLEAEGEG